MSLNKTMSSKRRSIGTRQSRRLQKLKKTRAEQWKNEWLYDFEKTRRVPKLIKDTNDIESYYGPSFKNSIKVFRGICCTELCPYPMKLGASVNMIDKKLYSWTTDPYVALFFALHDVLETNDSPTKSGVVFQRTIRPSDVYADFSNDTLAVFKRTFRRTPQRDRIYANPYSVSIDTKVKALDKLTRFIDKSNKQVFVPSLINRNSTFNNSEIVVKPSSYDAQIVFWRTKKSGVFYKTGGNMFANKLQELDLFDNGLHYPYDSESIAFDLPGEPHFEPAEFKYK